MRTLPRVCLIVAAVLLIGSSFAAAQDDEPAQNARHDFAISRAWLEALRAQKTFLPTFRVEMEHRVRADALEIGGPVGESVHTTALIRTNSILTAAAV